MLRTTAGRAAALQRASFGAAAAHRLSARQFPQQLSRPISFLPWRRKADPTLPVFFPKPAPDHRRTPWKKVRYAVLSVAVYYALWQIYMSVVLDPLLDWAENEWDSMSEQEKQEMEKEVEDEDGDPLLFLPFPFTTKEVHQRPYKGSDPEWKAFVKVNKDANLQKQMKHELAEGVRKAFEKNPTTHMLLGGKPAKVRKIWLDILYPPRPPPKHYVSGLIVDWDGLFWGDRSIDSVAAHRLNAIQYPKAVALASWTFVNVLLQSTKDTVTNALGFGTPKEPDTSWQSVMMERGKERRRGLLGPEPSKPPPVLHPQSPAVHTPPTANPSASGQFPASNSPHDLLSSMLKRPIDASSPYSINSIRALQAASLTFAKNWKPTQPAVNRGCIRVDGLVELQGESTNMVLHVLGWYDPKLRKYVNVQTKLKHVTRGKQKPLGGA